MENDALSKTGRTVAMTVEKRNQAKPLPPETLSVVERYLSYGWRWGVFTSLINRQFDTEYRPKELEQAYKLTKKLAKKSATK